MSNILQWVALAVCLGCTIWRFPTMMRGRNRGLFWAFAMMSVSIGLSIPAIYLPVDGVLGGVNLANVVLRLSLFAVFFLLASKVSAAYNSGIGRTLIRGPLGIAVLVACSVGIWITYFVSELHGSSAGLVGFFDQTSVNVYMWFGKVYLAYAAATLVVPTWRAAFSGRPAMDRAAALSMCAGFILVCSTAVVQMTPWHQLAIMTDLSFASILLVAAGLILVWVSFLRNPLKQP